MARKAWILICASELRNWFYFSIFQTLLDKSGQKIPKFTFKDYVNKHQIHGEVSIMFKGEFWMYGGTTGANSISSISKVINCEVKEVGQIRRDNKAVNFGLGKGVVRNDETIYLCFSHWMFQGCIKSNDPLGQFTSIFKIFSDYNLFRGNCRMWWV